MHQLDFIRPDREILSFKVEIDETDQDTILNSVNPFLLEDYLYLQLSNHSYRDLIRIYNDGKDISEEELGKLLWSIDCPKYRCIRVKQVTCEGCINDVANQFGHMEYGGCLYIGTDDESF